MDPVGARRFPKGKTGRDGRVVQEKPMRQPAAGKRVIVGRGAQ